MRVIIDTLAAFPIEKTGGVGRFAISLIAALGKLLDSPEEYIVVSSCNEPDWLISYLGPNQSIALSPRPVDRWDSAKRLLGPLRRPAGLIRRRLRNFLFDYGFYIIKHSKGFYENFDADVIHFPLHDFVHCELPMVYTIHDLRHLNCPHLTTREDIVWHDTVFKNACNCAAMVTTVSKWVRNDIIKQYGVNQSKVIAIPHAPPTEFCESIASEELVEIRRKYTLPKVFILYPAMTLKHKNHIRLIEAVRILRDRDGIRIYLVCTGAITPFFATIEKHIRRSRLQDQVRFLGWVNNVEILSLYRMAQFVVFPSLFEGGGLPLLEAFKEGIPITCSEIPPLREYGEDAVLYFDPTSIESIAEALRRMILDSTLRNSLIARGTERIRKFTWERTAKMYRAVYRKVAGYPLSDEDHYLLSETDSR